MGRRGRRGQQKRGQKREPQHAMDGHKKEVVEEKQRDPPPPTKKELAMRRQVLTRVQYFTDKYRRQIGAKGSEMTLDEIAGPVFHAYRRRTPDTLLSKNDVEDILFYETTTSDGGPSNLPQ